jgi:tetratricopeptide (TPR) repeat protein
MQAQDEKIDRNELIERARALAAEALTTGNGSDPSDAIRACDQALSLLEGIGASETLADVLRWKGSILRDSGDHARAMDLFAQSLSVADTISYTAGRAHALNCFGTMAQCRGDLKRATSWLEAARGLAVTLKSKRLQGLIEQNLGIVAALDRRPQDALDFFKQSQEAFEGEGDMPSLLRMLSNLGNLYTREGRYDLASVTLHRALHLAARLGDVAAEGVVEENRARFFLATNCLDDAQEAATRALGVAAQRSDATRQAAALYTLACVMRRRGTSSTDVLATLDRAHKLAQMGMDDELKREILCEMAEASASRERLNERPSFTPPVLSHPQHPLRQPDLRS